MKIDIKEFIKKVKNHKKIIIISSAIIVIIAIISVSIAWGISYYKRKTDRFYYYSHLGMDEDFPIDGRISDIMYKYEKDKISGSKVKQLIKKVNKFNADPFNELIQITIRYNIDSKISNNKYYKVECIINGEDGSVNPMGGRLEFIDIIELK